MPLNVLIVSISGDVNLIPSISLYGIMFTLHLMPFKIRIRRLASWGESLISFINIYSNVIWRLVLSIYSLQVSINLEIGYLLLMGISELLVASSEAWSETESSTCRFSLASLNISGIIPQVEMVILRIPIFRHSCELKSLMAFRRLS